MPLNDEEQEINDKLLAAAQMPAVQALITRYARIIIAHAVLSNPNIDPQHEDAIKTIIKLTDELLA